MPNLTAPDVFDLANTPLDENFLIEASAGTGKTFSLIHIVLRLIVEKGLSVDRLLLVTFTKAATAELRQRVRKLLTQMRDTLEDPNSEFAESQHETLYRKWIESGPDNDIILVRIKAALEAMDDCSICTIHSFCQAILEDNTFSSAEGFDFEIGDDGEIKHQVVEDFLREEVLKTQNDRVKCALSEVSVWTEKLAQLVKAPKGANVAYRYPLEDVDAKTGRALNPVDEEFEAELLTVMKRFVQEVPARFYALKKREQIRTFDDLLLDVYAALDHEGFVHSVRSSFDAVLIDEFQDTDPVQNRIFERIFIEPDASSNGKNPLVIFVGDPKQSIYRFRNADIATYLRAAEGIKKYQLSSNFRSAQPIIEACNRFFADAGTDTAFFNDSIRYSPINAQSKKEPLWVESTEGDKMLPAFEIWYKAIEGPAMRASDTDWQQDQIIASEIKALTSGRVYKDQKKTQPLKASDICILVKKKSDANGLVKALAEHQIRAITPESADVFATEEADDILKLLYALEEIDHVLAVKLARTTRLMGESVNEVSPERFEESETSNDNTLAIRQLLQEAQNAWQYAGVAGAFSLIMGRCKTRERLLPQKFGERRLTNYAHVIELLQEQSNTYKSISGLTRWFKRNIPPADSKTEVPEERQLRLDSDADLVTIMTIHKSKGLEFPVVILLHPRKQALPMPQNTTTSVFKHVDGPAVHFEFSHKSLYAKVDAEGNEQQENELTRLVYVAMTRASQRLVLPMMLPRRVYGRSKPKPDNVANAYTWALLKRKKPQATELINALSELIEALKAQSSTPDAFAIHLVDDEMLSFGWHALCPKVKTEEKASVELTAGEAKPVLTQWFPTSYTALARGAIELSEAEVRSLEVEDELPLTALSEPDASTEITIEKLQASALTVNDLPRGLEAGTFIHSLFERADFSLVREASQGNTEALDKLKTAVRRQIRIFAHLFTDRSLDEYTNVCTELLINVLNATIADEETSKRLGLQKPLILSSLPPAAFIREMAFTVPISPAKENHFAATPAGLSALLKTFDSRYHVELPSERDLTGYLTGAIDLTFEFEGKYYVLDWKGTRLGENAQDYSSARIDAEMQKHHYPLQYLIYLVALKRYLAMCGIEKPTSKLGGAFYVFVRGVRQNDNPALGIMFDKPSEKLIDALDAFFADGLSPEAIEALSMRAR